MDIRDLASVCHHDLYKIVKVWIRRSCDLTRIMNVRDVLDHILNTISLLALHHSITSLSHQRKAPGLHRIIEQHMSNVLHCLIVAFECKALKASVISSGRWPKSICGLGEEQTSQ